MTTETCFVVDLSTNPSMDTILSHPVMAFKAKFDKAMYAERRLTADTYTEFFTADFEFKDAEDQTHHGVDSFTKFTQIFGMLSEVVEHCHFGVVQPVEGGYNVVGEGAWFFNFMGEGGDEKTITDPFGKKWEATMPAAARLSLITDSSAPHGLKIATYKVYGNSAPVMMGAVKRGLIPQEALAAMGLA